MKMRAECPGCGEQLYRADRGYSLDKNRWVSWPDPTWRHASGTLACAEPEEENDPTEPQDRRTSCP